MQAIKFIHSVCFSLISRKIDTYLDVIKAKGSNINNMNMSAI